ncbi:hypothetical protein GUJ93_ZPchr0010g9337 [Zizania palustris]|uniref:Mitogen-activated protein kinase n=1 Tax=Zizania palustris TaxID=103762 RepID=A0A8J5VTA3_ZIZPA|nr:hypothetical protein GUJ93_ZPchr0010g9337 [Zizania palustris]
MDSSSGGGGAQIKGMATHGGRYVLYNVYGNLFEVSSKYAPPIRPIGRGAYGIVCAAVNLENSEEVAIKKIGNAFDNHIDAKRTLREIKLLRHMDHENIIAIKDIIRPPRRDNFNDVYLISELMDTDLHQIIRSNQPLTDDHCQYFLYQLLRGLKYVHSANVLHRDLKPSNLFLNANCDLKIADFGLARTTSETDLMTEYVVTRWYRAPELLLNCSQYTAAIDVWSVGCILGEIVTRQPLFPGRDYIQQLKLITELIGSPDDSSLGFLRSDNARRYMKQLPQYPRQDFRLRFRNMSSGAVDLLERMLVFDPSRRITVDEALHHPYLTYKRTHLERILGIQSRSSLLRAQRTFEDCSSSKVKTILPCASINFMAACWANEWTIRIVGQSKETAFVFLFTWPEHWLVIPVDCINYCYVSKLVTV